MRNATPAAQENNHRIEILSGSRFEFGANWARFLRVLDNKRISLAEESLCKMLNVENMDGKRFLDAGSGSGLFSLAARRKGALVHSFDYDPQSVACTRELRNKYLPDDSGWVIEEGSVLDQDYLARLGRFDVVYSWGVLHHTASMWEGLANIAALVEDGGRLYVAIYNDQGWISRYWTFVKKCSTSNIILRWVIVSLHLPYLFALRFMVRAVTGRLALERGMSLWYDMLDWIGGYPFEVARPQEIFEFYRDKGFRLDELRTCGGRHGCNEFVFSKTNSGSRK